MEKLVIKENKLDRKLRIELLKGHMFPMLRSMLWGLLAVVICYGLFALWGQKFPVVLWGVPILGPLFWLQGAVQANLPVRWVFTASYIQEEGGTAKKVLWRRVKAWHYELDEEKVTIYLRMPLGGRHRFMFHRSHGVDEIIYQFRCRLEKPPEF